ncbi:MAG: recombinase family protein [Clostridiales bacterium]|jgi:DNA invertase Pin-like site-specific DNA recombinase|nr:recombinase family protein [Clostridiales bacterium]
MLIKRQNRAAIYCRLSRDDGGDAESNSIINQRALLQRYAKDNNFIIHDEYVDDGYSGTGFDRPEFKRMIADIEDGKINTVICKDLSRLGRNNAMVAYYTEIFFPDNNVRFVAVNDAIDTFEGENEIMAFKSVINEYYARDISKKVRSSKRIRAINGQHNSGNAPYGYAKNPEDRHKLIIDEEAAKTVRAIFSMAADGVGYYSISKWLYNENILTPAAYFHQQTGKNNYRFDPDFPCDWSPRSIQRILRSMVYIGHMVSHKQASKSFKNHKLIDLPKEEWIIVENTHEPIIDPDLFEKVQQIISVKKRANKRLGSNIFAGLLICADCGRHLVYMSTQGRFNCDGYRHSNRVGADRRCTPHGVSYAAVYETVAANMNAVVSGVFNKSDFITQMLKSTEDTSSHDQKALQKLISRDNELKTLIKKAFERNALGFITDSTFEDLYGGYQKEQNAVTAKIDKLQAKLSAEKSNNTRAGRILELTRHYTEISELTRETLLDLIEKIVVYEPSRTGENKRGCRLDIHYRFTGKTPDSEVSL